MLVRKVLLPLAALALSAGAPASGEEAGGVGTEVAGTVYASTQEAPPRVPSEDVAAKCSYVGHPEPDGRWRYEFAGEATAYSTSSKQPQVTVVDCWMEARDGSPVSAHAILGCPGTTCATAGTAGPWQKEDVKVCLSAKAIFGPVGPVEKSTGTHCS